MSRRTDAFTQARTQATALLEDHPKLEPAVKDLDYCATDGRFRRAVGRLWDARAGLPGAASYEGRTSGGSPGSVVERLAEQGDPTQSQRDAFDGALRNLATCLRRLDCSKACQHAHTLRLFIDAYGLPPRAANARERAEVERLNAPPVDCEHHTTAGLYELASHHGTVAGNLDVPMRLCDFCYREVYRKGVLPRGEVLDDRHRKGKNPMVPA